MRRALALTVLLCACPDREVEQRPPETPACSLTLEALDGLDLAAQGTGACPHRVALRLRVATGSPSSPVWHDAGTSPIRVSGGWTTQGEVLLRGVRVENRGEAPASLVGLEWSTPAGGLDLKASRLLQNGYQSWSYTGFLPIPRTVTSARGTASHGGDNEDLTGEVHGVSWWWTFLGGADGQGLVAGADGGTVFKTYLAVDRGDGLRLRIVQGVTGDALTLRPGESRALDGLFLGLGGAGALLDRYAARVAELHPPAAPRKPALGGWGSWNVYYEEITAPLLREEAAWARSTLAPLGLADLLLDDGYEPHWGVWRESEEFGASLQDLAAEQQAAGLRPAIWLAPFYVAVGDPLVAEHPDWFVRAEDGKLRTFSNFGPDYAALDASSPGARAHVASAVKQLRDWGFRTLKIDFLFGGAVEGVRQQPLTSLESYGLWMKTLREAVPDVHLVGCGAPILPSVGWVDSMRTGPDIAVFLTPEPRFPYIAAQARHSALRAHTATWWSLDPDVVLLRGEQIDDAQAWTAVVSAALTGGNYLLGDGRQAPAARLALSLAPEILALTRDGLAARAEDLAALADEEVIDAPLIADLNGVFTAVPRVWRKTSADGRRAWLAAFAWAGAKESIQVELPAGAVELVPTSQGRVEPVPAAAGDQAVEVPAGGVRLFRWDL